MHIGKAVFLNIFHKILKQPTLYIPQTTEDLNKVDQERKAEFKNYELEKEYTRQQELQHMDETHRKEAEEKHQQELNQHKQHDKLHHPGSKQQLEEVGTQMVT